MKEKLMETERHVLLETNTQASGSITVRIISKFTGNKIDMPGFYLADIFRPVFAEDEQVDLPREDMYGSNTLRISGMGPELKLTNKRQKVEFNAPEDMERFVEKLPETDLFGVEEEDKLIFEGTTGKIS